MRKAMRWGAAAGLLMVCVLAWPGRLLGLRNGAGGQDRVAIFSTLVVNEGETAGDVVCAFCTVRVEGEVRGDVAVVFSTLSVAEGQTIAGDVAGLFSTLHLADGTRVNGDLAWMLGATDVAPSATVAGDRAVLGRGWGLLLVAVPLLILVGLVWLGIWVVRLIVR